MKTFLRLNIVLGLIIAIPNLCSFSQVSINNDGSAPHNSAMLEVESTTKGFLPPVMTSAQMNAIPNPAGGLVVYNSSTHSLVFYNGSVWKRPDGKNYIGESFGGGIIFYVDSTGQHGLICAAADQINNAGWNCYGELIGTSTAIGTGQANTTAIVNGCVANYGALLCDELDLNGYSDWFMPSKDELNELYLQKDVISGLGDYYWSSSEYDAYDAWFQYFGYDLQYYYPKYHGLSVRAIRAF